MFALAVCGAVLLVPLALSAPGAAPGPVQEVVLAAGSPEVGPLDEPSDPVEVPAPDEEAAPAQDDSQPSHLSVRRRESTTRPSETKAAAPARTSSTSKPKAGPASAVGRPTTTTTEAAAPPAPPARAAAVARAATGGAPPPATTVPPPPPPPAPAPAAVAADEVWDRLAACESSNVNDAGGPYYGYWQFSADTWHSVGEPGLPYEHPRNRQLAAAKRLQGEQGWAPWPACSRRLGLH